MAKRTLTVADVMSTEVFTLGRNDSLKLADELLEQRRIRHIPVLDDDGLLCGVVTQRDLFRGAVLRALGYGKRAEDMMLASLAVKEAMSEPAVTIGPEATLADAGRLMLERHIGCLPVVEGERLVGIVTEGDFVRLALRG